MKIQQEQIIGSGMFLLEFDWVMKNGRFEWKVTRDYISFKWIDIYIILSNRAAQFWIN